MAAVGEAAHPPTVLSFRNSFPPSPLTLWRVGTVVTWSFPSQLASLDGSPVGQAFPAGVLRPPYLNSQSGAGLQGPGHKPCGLFTPGCKYSVFSSVYHDLKWVGKQVLRAIGLDPPAHRQSRWSAETGEVDVYSRAACFCLHPPFRVKLTSRG